MRSSRAPARRARAIALGAAVAVAVAAPAGPACSLAISTDGLAGGAAPGGDGGGAADEGGAAGALGYGSAAATASAIRYGFDLYIEAGGAASEGLFARVLDSWRGGGSSEVVLVVEDSNTRVQEAVGWTDGGTTYVQHTLKREPRRGAW